MFYAILSISAFVVAITLHETAHGYVAYRLGDPTAHSAKRLTLNPLAHIDPFGTVLLPLFLALTGAPVFGWAKPVPFNPGYFKDPQKGTMLVGAAGPATNLVVAVLAGMLYRALPVLPPIPRAFLELLCIVNVYLAVFNMIPIPPLDGSRVVVGFLPPHLVRAYLSIERYGFLIIFGLLWLGALRTVVFPVAEALFTVLLG